MCRTDKAAREHRENLLAVGKPIFRMEEACSIRAGAAHIAAALHEGVPRE